MKIPPWAVGLIGKLSIWCTVFLSGFFAIFLSAMAGMALHHEVPRVLKTIEPLMPVIGLLLIPTLAVTVLLQFLLLLHALRNSRLSPYRRALWALSFFLLLGIVVMPLYWYRYMVRDADEDRAAGRSE